MQPASLNQLQTHDTVQNHTKWLQTERHSHAERISRFSVAFRADDFYWRTCHCDTNRSRENALKVFCCEPGSVKGISLARFTNEAKQLARRPLQRKFHCATGDAVSNCACLCLCNTIVYSAYYVTSVRPNLVVKLLPQNAYMNILKEKKTRSHAKPAASGPLFTT